MKTTKTNYQEYKGELNGVVWTISKEVDYWRAEDGEQVWASKTKKGAINSVVNGYNKDTMFHEWI